MRPIAGVATFVVIDLVALAFCAFSFRVLWRRGETPREKLIYDHGVRRFGIQLGIALSLVGLLVDQERFADVDVVRILAYDLASIALNLGGSLWAGLVWGKAMARFFAPREK